MPYNMFAYLLVTALPVVAVGLGEATHNEYKYHDVPTHFPRLVSYLMGAAMVLLSIGFITVILAGDFSMLCIFAVIYGGCALTIGLRFYRKVYAPRERARWEAALEAAAAAQAKREAEAPPSLGMLEPKHMVTYSAN